MVRHENNGRCPKCAELLKLAHPKLRAFAEKRQSENAEVHVSCTFRDKADQDRAFAIHASDKKWPMSKHNRTPSYAVDFFQIDRHGNPQWNKDWFLLEIGVPAERAGFRWGGDWDRDGVPHERGEGDNPHVEIP